MIETLMIGRLCFYISTSLSDNSLKPTIKKQKPHTLKGYNVAVVDCDYPQHSITAMRKLGISVS